MQSLLFTVTFELSNRFSDIINMPLSLWSCDYDYYYEYYWLAATEMRFMVTVSDNVTTIAGPTVTPHQITPNLYMNFNGLENKIKRNRLHVQINNLYRFYIRGFPVVHTHTQTLFNLYILFASLLKFNCVWAVLLLLLKL